MQKTQQNNRFAPEQRVLITTAALDVETVGAMQEAFGHSLDIIHRRAGSLAIVPAMEDFEYLAGLLLTNGMNVLFHEQKMPPAYL